MSKLNSQQRDDLTTRMREMLGNGKAAEDALQSVTYMLAVCAAIMPDDSSFELRIRPNGLTTLTANIGTTLNTPAVSARLVNAMNDLTPKIRELVNAHLATVLDAVRTELDDALMKFHGMAEPPQEREPRGIRLRDVKEDEAATTK